MQILQSRRDFLASLSAAGAVGVMGGPCVLADEGPPEVTTIRLGYWPQYACVSPHTIAEELLRAEGFTDVRYVSPSHVNSVARGEIDFELQTAAWVVSQVDACEPITALAGVHVGCFELFVHEPIRTIGDLRGRKVGIDYLGSSAHMYLSIMLAQVGLDPKRTSSGSPTPSTGSRILTARSSTASPTRGSMRSSASRPSLRSCATGASAG